ncbi:MAG TPA: beta-galactosidase [Verrucomicrobiae bacterium]|nr:beta-galactosidase [Verrucomicrobiae bacterium]
MAVVGAGMLVGLASGTRVYAQNILFAFTHGSPNDAVEMRAVDISPAPAESGMALRVDGGDDPSWAGLVLKAPHGRWNLSEHDGLLLDVRNVGSGELTLECRVENADADPPLHCNQGEVTLAPGARGTLDVRFKRSAFSLASLPMFGMRAFPPPDAGENTIDPSAIAQVYILVPTPKGKFSFEIGDVRLSPLSATVGRPSEDLRWMFPFIDTFGQYMHADWPNKVHSVDDLIAKRAAEAANLEAEPRARSWDRYGGWKRGPLLLGTGYFRTAKYGGKWWLVDPEGRLFFSNGIDCIWPGESTPINGRAAWFQDFPGNQEDFRQFLSTRGQSEWGHYLDATPSTFDFAGVNLKRKYGTDWRKDFYDTTQLRLRSWGLNTIGNWSDPALCAEDRTPYVAAVHFASKPLEGTRGLWGRFRDVFDPNFGTQLRASMADQAAASADDPWCIGYFIDNELTWGTDVSFALATLDSPAYQAAKQVFVSDLMAKYRAIGKLNAAWGMHYKSWSDVIESRELPDKTRAHDDLAAFYRHTVAEYFRLCRQAVRETAPNHLYLGCRFAAVNAEVVKIAARYCDVLSYNIYRRSVADFSLPSGVDAPVIIGEFHFGATDRGQFSPGLVRVKDQAERAAAYESFVSDALRHPNFVGCHWFSYRDEPTTGRTLDGENYQNGFVDVADTPYGETVNAAREIGYKMYEIRAGVEQPVHATTTQLTAKR